MSENLRIQMANQLANALHDIVAALTSVGVNLPPLTPDAVDVDLFRWEAILWRAADVLATPDGPARAHWSKTHRLEVAARNWSHAAGVYSLYTQLPMPSREDLFARTIAQVGSEMMRFRAARAGRVGG